MNSNNLDLDKNENENADDSLHSFYIPTDLNHFFISTEILPTEDGAWQMITKSDNSNIEDDIIIFATEDEAKRVQDYMFVFAKHVLENQHKKKYVL